MSKERIEVIPCPKCGHEQNFTVFESLNGDLDPAAKMSLLNAELFKFRCGECEFETNVVYDILYHDMTHQAMVYLIPKNAVEEVTRMMDHADTAFGFGTSNYRKRIVFDQNALREKALIFDNGLDDRIMEIVKTFYLSNAREQFPDANIEAAYFFVKDGAYMLEFVGEIPLMTEIAVDFYAQVGMQYMNVFNDISANTYIIDANWAARVLNGEIINEH
jgi:hypothetical protein